MSKTITMVFGKYRIRVFDIPDGMELFSAPIPLKEDDDLVIDLDWGTAKLLQVIRDGIVIWEKPQNG